jgi:hypothetical protein
VLDPGHLQRGKVGVGHGEQLYRPGRLRIESAPCVTRGPCFLPFWR